MNIRPGIAAGLLASVMAMSAATAAKPAVDVLEGIDVDFDLVGAGGRRVTDEDLAGHHVLLVFGFTHCPYVCPTMTAAVAAAIASSSADATGVFISVDTERDTPDVTNAYAAGFGERMLGLSGSYEQVAEAAKHFKITFAVTKTQGAYTVQHTANIYVIRPNGSLKAVFPMDATPAVLAAALRD